MRVVSTVVLVLLLALPLFAAVPQTVNYQGYLKNTDGTPVNTAVNATFSLYSSNPARNNPVWRESRSIVPTNGIYSVQLGLVTPLTAPFDVPYSLGIKVGGDPEMTPLQQLASAPYALRANVANSLAAGSVTTSAIADGSVTDAKIVGAISDSKLSGNVALLNSTQTFTGTKTFTDLQVASPALVTSLNADLLDNLHASDIISSAADQCTAAVSALQSQLAALQKQNSTLQTMLTSVLTSSLFQNRWGTAQLIETNDAGIAYSPRVAVDTAGNALAVWQQSDGTRYNIWANRYMAGTGWGTPQLIETDNAGSAFSPQVTMDAAGNAITVWHQSDGIRYNIWANRYTTATGCGTAQLIETDNAGTAQLPQVVADAAGNAIAVWNQSDGTRYNIWANRYTAGVGWGTAQLIETDNIGDARFPQVATDAAGNVVAVWHQSDGTRYNIWTNRHTVGAGWGTAQLIETDNAGEARYPQVAADATGNAVAVWQQSDGIRYNIWANRYTVGTGWGTAQLIETDNAGPATYPQVAVDPAGNAIVVWSQSDGSRANIWANRFMTGAGWGTPQLIETDNAGDASNVQVAVDPAGNAVVVWQQLDSSLTTNIWANRFSR